MSKKNTLHQLKGGVTLQSGHGQEIFPPPEKKSCITPCGILEISRQGYQDFEIRIYATYMVVGCAIFSNKFDIVM